MKRNAAVNVKMTDADLRLMKEAAELLWPGAIMSNSSIVLSLARIAANDALKRRKKDK